MAGKRSRSRKRSGTRTRTQPPEPVFFVDRSLEAHSVVRALQRAGLTVERHSAHFPSDAADQEWLARAGEEGWFVLTKDTRIRRRALERNALMAARVGAFVLVAGNLRAEETGEIMRRCAPRMLRIARARPRPFIAGITRTGVVLYSTRKGR